MSYRSPSNKSKYGDDLFEDKWSQTPGTQEEINSHDITPFSSSSSYNPSTMPVNQQPLNQQRAGTVTDFAVIQNSMTQEDILFMRRWKQDCFYKRELPMTIAGMGALHMYQRKKGLPYKLAHYALIGVTTYIIAKVSYIGELKRRLRENTSNTPYMQAFRKVIGVEPRINEFASDPNIDSASTTVADLSGWSGREASADGYSSFGQEKRPVIEPDRSSNSNSGSESILSQSTTYDELRARNRGYSK